MNPSLNRRQLFGGLILSGSAALVLSACGGGSDSGDGPVTAFTSEPENPLVPTNTTEQGGGRVVSLIFHGLITYDDDAKPVNALAESIESQDNRNWTIKIKPGKKFSNGEDITAQSFADAWNYGAAAKNAQLGSYFFETIKGYEDVSAEGSTSENMEGLKVKDDTTLEVELTAPDVTFATRLGYAAYAPLPASAFQDMKAFGENPVGWGPFKMDGEGAWVHDQEIRLVKNEDYDGPTPATLDALTFVVYQTTEAGYTDLISGNLDLLDAIPTGSIEVADGDLNGRVVKKAYAGNYSFGIPYYLKGWSGEEGRLRRQAISRAVDRQQLIDVVFKGVNTPAKDFTSPAVAGFPGSFKNEQNVTFDAEAAKKLWQQADGIAAWDDSKPFELAYNADGGHKEWVDAVCNMISNALGIKAQGKPYATFKELRTEANDKKLTSAVRTGWMADYPSMYNFLSAQFATKGSSNDVAFQNTEFDQLLQDGLRAGSLEEANQKFVQADELLLEELPAIPLYYPERQTGYSENVSDVDLTWNGEIDYPAVSQA